MAAPDKKPTFEELFGPAATASKGEQSFSDMLGVAAATTGPEKRSFEEIFGPNATAPITNYCAPADVGEQPILMPQPHDSLAVIAQKIERMAQVVLEGKSLALYTGYVAEKTQGTAGIAALERAELQTARDSLSVARRRVNEVTREMRRLTRSIDCSQKQIQARMCAIKTKIDGRQTVVKKESTDLGNTRGPLKADVDDSKVALGKRRRDADLSRGTGIQVQRAEGDDEEEGEDNKRRRVD